MNTSQTVAIFSENLILPNRRPIVNKSENRFEFHIYQEKDAFMLQLRTKLRDFLAEADFTHFIIPLFTEDDFIISQYLVRIRGRFRSRMSLEFVYLSGSQIENMYCPYSALRRLKTANKITNISEHVSSDYRTAQICYILNQTDTVLFICDLKNLGLIYPAIEQAYLKDKKIIHMYPNPYKQRYSISFEDFIASNFWRK